MKTRTVTFTFNENFLSKLYWADTEEEKVFSAPSGPYNAGDKVKGSEWLLHFLRIKQLEILMNDPSYVNYARAEFNNINQDDHLDKQRLFEKTQIDDNKLITTFLAIKDVDNQKFQSKFQWYNDNSYEEHSKKYATLHEKSIEIINASPNISVTSSIV